jgi:hypothetical protein
MREALNRWAPTMAVSFNDLDWSDPRAAMPKLRPDIGNAVFYLYRINPKTGEKTGPHGSGFVVARNSKVLPNFKHYYGVTNWHLSNDLGASIIRVNTTDGKSRYLDYGPEDWQFIKDGDDLSMIDLTDDARMGDQVSHYIDTGFVDKAFIERFGVGFGEDVFMTGLFADQHGGDRNTPAARFGNVSLLADESAPIEQPNGMLRPSHLVDMRSRTGFSGSPVCLYRIPGIDLSDTPQRDEPFAPTGGLPWNPQFMPKFIALFGVHCGQYYDEVEVLKTRPEWRERHGDPIQEGDKLYIQSGMTIVVPAWRVTEMMNLEVFEMARKKREEDRGDAARRRPQPEAVEVPTSTGDANPAHREDFNTLLSAAVKPQDKA